MKTLTEIIVSGLVGVVSAIGIHAQNTESYLEHYINVQAREEHVMQFEQGKPQSETMWDHLQGKGNAISAGLGGLGFGVFLYATNSWMDKRRERKRKEELKRENPILYAIRYPDEKK